MLAIIIIFVVIESEFSHLFLRAKHFLGLLDNGILWIHHIRHFVIGFLKKYFNFFAFSYNLTRSYLIWEKLFSSLCTVILLNLVTSQNFRCCEMLTCGFQQGHRILQQALHSDKIHIIFEKLKTTRWAKYLCKTNTYIPFISFWH